MTTREEKARRMELRRDNGTRSVPKRVPRQKGPPYAAHFVCIACRKSFKRRLTVKDYPDGWPKHLPCPQCGGPSLNFGRKFKPPKQTDKKQWEKVRILAENGFWFHSIGSRKYPETLSEVPEFLETYAHAIRPVDPELWEKVIEYCERET